MTRCRSRMAACKPTICQLKSQLIQVRRQEGAVDWNEVSTIADVLAAISLILTVVYLAIQIRKNTHATHSQTYHLATSALAEMAGIIGSNKELARIFRRGMTNPDELEEDEF